MIANHESFMQNCTCIETTIYEAFIQRSIEYSSAATHLKCQIEKGKIEYTNECESVGLPSHLFLSMSESVLKQ